MTSDVERRRGVERTGARRSHRLSVNAVINLTGNVAYYAAVVIVTPIAIRGLGEERWGIWMLVGAAANCAVLLNLGLNSAIALHVSRGAASSDSEDLGRSIHAARIYLLAAGALIVAATLAGGRWFVESAIAIPQTGLAHRALLASALVTAATLPIRIFSSALAGLQRFDLLAWFRIAAGVLLIAAVVGGFTLGMGLVEFAVVMTIAPALPGALGWVAARRLLPRSCFAWRRTDFARLREMLAYSVNTILYVSGTVLMYQSLKFVASAQLGGAAAAGHFGVAIALSQTLSVAFVPLAAVLQPRVADLATRGQQSEVPTLLARSLAATGLLGIPAVVFLGIEANSVFNAWVGDALPESVVEALAETVRWMLVGQSFYVIFLPCFYVLLGIGEHRSIGAGMLLACAAMTLIGIAISEVRPEISSLGMAFGGTLGAFVLIATVPAALRRFSMRWSTTLRQTLLVPLLVALPGAVALKFRPTSREPLVDLALAVAIFAAFSIPGLLVARRSASGPTHRPRPRSGPPAGGAAAQPDRSF